jgi:hypothetical protein
MLGASAVFLCAAALFLGVQMRMLASGYVSLPTQRVWGEAIAITDRQWPISVLTTAYPPLPVQLTVLTEFLLGRSTIPSPLLVAVVLGALVALLWLRSFRMAGHGLRPALFFTIVLIVHPFFLWLLSEGPAGLVLILGSFLLARGLFRIRARGSVVDAMTIGVALAVLAAAHPIGLALGFASIPFLALAMPPDLVARSAIGTYLSVLFPWIFAVLALAFLNLIFNGEPWRFLDPTVASAVSIDEATGTLPAPLDLVDLFRSFAQGLVAAIIAMPVILLVLVETSQRLPLLMPTLAIIGISVSAAAFAHAYGATPEPTLALTPLVGFVAAGVAAWPNDTRKQVLLGIFLLLGLAGGSILALGWRAPELVRWRDAMLGAPQAATGAAAIIGARLAGVNDVLIDGELAPEIIAGRRSAVGLILPRDDRFHILALSGQLDASHVVVSNPEWFGDRDRVNRAFPRLYAHGAPGYVQAFEGAGFRVYRRHGLRLLSGATP